MFNGFLVAGVLRSCLFGILRVGTMVHKDVDGYAPDQIGNSSHVIAVIVGDQDVVDPLDPSSVGCSLDSLRVASSRPAGIDQYGFAKWTDNEGRLSSFDVDKKNLERFRRTSFGPCRKEKSSNTQEEDRNRGAQELLPLIGERKGSRSLCHLIGFHRDLACYSGILFPRSIAF